MVRGLWRALPALLCTAAAGACAPAIKFDPGGNACKIRGSGANACKSIDTLDVGVGNGTFAGINVFTPVGTIGSYLSQANLAMALLNGVPQYANGSNGVFFTIAVSAPHEVIAAASSTPGQFPSLILRPSGSNSVFRIYRHGSVGNDLAGLCFVESCGGVPILTGVVSQEIGTEIASITVNTSATEVTLDQTFNGNNYLNRTTLVLQGSLSFVVQVKSVSEQYFPGLGAGSSALFVTTQLTLPFTTANPAACFSANATTSCNVTGVTSGSSVNGKGANTMFQADASIRFIATPNAAPSPSPGTESILTLLAMAALASGGALRQRHR